MKKYFPKNILCFCFCFRKIRECSFPTSYWTPSNSYSDNLVRSAEYARILGKFCVFFDFTTRLDLRQVSNIPQCWCFWRFGNSSDRNKKVTRGIFEKYFWKKNILIFRENKNCVKNLKFWNFQPTEPSGQNKRANQVVEINDSTWSQLSNASNHA